MPHRSPEASASTNFDNGNFRRLVPFFGWKSRGTLSSDEAQLRARSRRYIKPNRPANKSPTSEYPRSTSLLLFFVFILILKRKPPIQFFFVFKKCLISDFFWSLDDYRGKLYFNNPYYFHIEYWTEIKITGKFDRKVNFISPRIHSREPNGWSVTRYFHRI